MSANRENFAYIDNLTGNIDDDYISGSIIKKEAKKLKFAFYLEKKLKRAISHLFIFLREIIIFSSGNSLNRIVFQHIFDQIGFVGDQAVYPHIQILSHIFFHIYGPDIYREPGPAAGGDKAVGDHVFFNDYKVAVQGKKVLHGGFTQISEHTAAGL